MKRTVTFGRGFLGLAFGLHRLAKGCVVKLQAVTIRNFRSLSSFTIGLDGETTFLIGECAVGKTSLLVAIFRGLGQERAFTKADFGDVNQAIEIELLLTDFDAEQRGILCDRIDFGEGTLRVGVRVTWDHDEEEPVVEHGYPARTWERSNPGERGALSAQWFPAERQVGRYLQFGSRRNLMAKVLDSLSLETEIETAVADLSSIAQSLGATADLQAALSRVRDSVSGMVPDVAADLLRLHSSASSDLQVLWLLDLFVAHHGEPVSVSQQSSGLAHLISFGFLIEYVQSQPGTILLIDEPEISLHPHPQRSLVRLLESLPCQALIATHSSNVLDRVDARKVVCLRRSDSNVEWSRAAAISDDEARVLARYTTPQTAEAFFAKSVVLVEGVSDLYSLVALAEKQGRDLDGEGVSIVDMEGAGGVKTFTALFGPSGFNLKLTGLCDADQESEWLRVLSDSGLVSGSTRSDLESIGFFVCDVDLEDELVRSFGDANAIALIDAVGEKSAFQNYCQQLRNRGKPQDELVRAFIGSKGRRKVRYAPLIVEQLDPSDVPTPLKGLLDSV